MLLRLASFAVLVGLLAPRSAEASLCVLENYTWDVPVGCPMIVNQQAAATLVVPTITARRDGQEVAVTVELVKSTPTFLDIYYSNQCGDETVSETRSEPYDVLELALSGVQFGDQLFVDGQAAGTVPETGPCPVPYTPWCNASDTVECPPDGEDPDPDGGGCNAGGGGGLAVGLGFALAALLRRKRARAHVAAL